jgi:predicted transcriptional regulator
MDGEKIMLTSVQKEILQTLINLYQSSNGKSIKGEDIAEVMNRNPGTIRNQMQALRSLSLVKGVPGPRGGYKPTIEAYHSLNISVSDDDSYVPIYKNGKRIEDVSVAKIEFTSIPQPTECEAAIKVLGSIKDLNLGDEVRIGPTPVNNLGVMGTIVGRDDIDNILLVDTKTIRSIPKQTVGDIASRDVISFSMDCSVKEAARKLAKLEIDENTRGESLSIAKFGELSEELLGVN